MRAILMGTCSGNDEHLCRQTDSVSMSRETLPASSSEAAEAGITLYPGIFSLVTCLISSDRFSLGEWPC